MANGTNLNVNFNLGAGSRLVHSTPFFDSDQSVCTFTTTLKTNGVMDMQVCRVSVTVTNTQSTHLERNVSPAVGLAIDDATRYFIVTQTATPTGYTDLYSAWKAGGNGAAQRNAFEAALSSLGFVGASLAGT